MTLICTDSSPLFSSSPFVLFLLPTALQNLVALLEWSTVCCIYFRFDLFAALSENGRPSAPITSLLPLSYLSPSRSSLPAGRIITTTLLFNLRCF